ncbi:hypothetical protein AGMMS49579_23720 [Spirochaetia bacterium]|nr:hypothetical protein AGMMS49579_23720 [Spirochaetia bacterium]
MSYKWMSFVERMDMFKLLYVEKQTQSKTAALLGRKPSTISREADYPEHTMSGKTIYNYVQLHMKGELKKLALEDLRQRGKPRKSGNTAEKRGKIPEMTL